MVGAASRHIATRLAATEAMDRHLVTPAAERYSSAPKSPSVITMLSFQTQSMLVQAATAQLALAFGPGIWDRRLEAVAGMAEVLVMPWAVRSSRTLNCCLPIRCC